MVLELTRPRVRQRASTWPPSSLMREMEALFREFSGERSPLRDQRLFPAVNVTHDADAFYLRAELPGMDLEALDLSVDQNKVTLRGGREISTEADEVSVHRRERRAGNFARTVTLPSDIDAENVEATYRDGVLTVTVPKAPEAKPRRIAVQSS